MVSDMANDDPRSRLDSDVVGAAVARNLALLRQEAGLSLEKLAERAGVSKAMLNQIEKGRSTPTITVLWKIADGLNVPFGRLLQVPRTEQPVLLRHGDSKVLLSADGAFASRALFPFDELDHSTEFYELTIKPGGREEAAPHRRGTREYLALVSGTAEISVAGEVHRLAPRDTLVFYADVTHAYANPHPTEDARLFLVMAYGGAVGATVPRR